MKINAAIQRPQESGVVLVMAIALMVGVVVIAVGAMQVTVTHAASEKSRHSRLQLRGLAEGGIDLGYQRLEDDPAFRGTFSGTASNGTTVTVAIVDAAGRIEIRANTEIGDLIGGVTALLEVVSTGPSTFDRPIDLGGKLTVDGGSFTAVGSTVRNAGGSFQFRSATINGDIEDSASVTPLVFSSVDFSAIATQTEANLTLTPGSYDFGALMVNGILTLQAPIEVTGSIFVTGGVTVEGNSAAVVLGTASASLTLISEGAVTIQDAASLIMNGTFANNGMFTIDTVPNASGSGGLYSNNALQLVDSTTTWTFDNSLLSEPTGVTGLPVTPGVSTYSEIWRATRIGTVAPSSPPPADAPPADSPKIDSKTKKI